MAAVAVNDAPMREPTFYLVESDHHHEPGEATLLAPSQAARDCSNRSIPSGRAAWEWC